MAWDVGAVLIWEVEEETEAKAEARMWDASGNEGGGTAVLGGTGDAANHKKKGFKIALEISDARRRGFGRTHHVGWTVDRGQGTSGPRSWPNSDPAAIRWRSAVTPSASG